jgi:UMF1 family MFS transporter
MQTGYPVSAANCHDPCLTHMDNGVKMPSTSNPAPRHQKRSIWGWALYDWANSAFTTTVMAVFFPILFKQYWNQGIDVNISTFRLGLGNALASLVVAASAPVLGAFADHSGRRKGLLICFTYLGVLMTATLALIPQGDWFPALCVYGIGVIGFSGSVAFYDALLPQVAPVDRMDQVSSLGYALGYLGGGLLLAINVMMTLKPRMFGLADAAQAVKASFVTVALWWGLFALITFAWVPADSHTRPLSLRRQLAEGWRKVIRTLKKIQRRKVLFTFLLAYWCYIDGVDTIVRMAVDYGISIGFKQNDLIAAFLITQFIGFPSALLFGQLGKIWGVRRAIYLALGIYIIVTIWGAVMTRPFEFYLLAAVIGLVQGGIQALSRSYYARLIPHGQSAEFFGFYNMLGKFAAIIGPLLMGLTGLIAKRLLLPPMPTDEQIIAAGLTATRLSIISIILLFIAGGVLFYFVDEEKGRKELIDYPGTAK